MTLLHNNTRTNGILGESTTHYLLLVVLSSSESKNQTKSLYDIILFVELCCLKSEKELLITSPNMGEAYLVTAPDISCFTMAGSNAADVNDIIATSIEHMVVD